MTYRLSLILLLWTLYGVSLAAQPRQCRWQGLVRDLRFDSELGSPNLNKYQSFIEALVLQYNPREKSQFIAQLKQDPTLKDLGIAEIVATELKPLAPNQIEAKTIIKSIDRAIRQTVADFNQPGEMLSYMERLENLGYPRDQFFHLLQTTPWKNQIPFDRIFFEQNNGLRFYEAWITGLKSQSSQVLTYSQFQSLLPLIKQSGLTRSELIRLVQETPFIRHLKRAKSNVVEQLDHELARAMARGSRSDISYILDNFDLYLRIIQAEDLAPIVSQVNSSLHFFTVIDRLVQVKQRGLLLEHLPDSPFAQRIGITRQNLNELLLHMDMILSETGPESLHQLMATLWPKWKNKSLVLSPYDREIALVEVKDQCAWGSCWVHGPTSKMEIQLYHSLGEPIPLSVDYLYLKHLINQYRQALNHEESSIHFKIDELITEGGRQSIFSHYLKIYGMIPRSIWQPKIPLHHHQNAESFVNRMNLLLRQYQRRKFTYEQEVKYQSLSTKEERIAYYDQVIREQEIAYYHEVESVVLDFFGKPPETFMFQGKSYTPQSFAQQMLPKSQGHIERLMLKNHVNPETVKPYKDIDEVEIYNPISMDLETVKIGSVERTVSLPDIEFAITDSINKNRPIVLSVRFPSRRTFTENGKEIPYIDHKTGKLTAPEIVVETLDMKKAGNHVMLIVGYELDVHGNIVTLKILNSYGTKRGDKGIYHMDINFFKNFLRYINVREIDGLGVVPEGNLLQSKRFCA